MKHKHKLKERWLKKPEPHDYPAAFSYLQLIFDKDTCKALERKLRAAGIEEFKAKDLFRASGVPLLPPSNVHVKRDQQKLQEGEQISPLLLVRDMNRGKLIIADGYHRLCAVYSLDEDAVIPCKIVST
jgi:disulfide oxidoreductase YuzD